MLLHRTSPRFCQPLAPGKLLLRLKTRRRAKQHCQVVYEDRGLQTAPMHVYARTPHYLYYQAEIELSRPGECRYFFRYQVEGEEPVYLFAGSNEQGGRPFTYRWTAADIFTIPEWIYDAVSYQIFPDRFYNGNPANDPPGTRPWGEAPTRENFFGGDLEGIQAKIPYLKFLGVNALWLNPIFASPSNHRYNTSDYLAVDPALGDTATLSRLVESLHAAGMHLILDGVFNHTGTEFFAFKDVVARGASSPYKDWYYFYDFPVRMEPRPNYTCWWDIPSLPKLKVSNPEVRNYLLQVATYWLREAGTDGWRLDVPNEIEPAFWREFRRQVKETNPQAYIVGEIWHDARFWLQGRLFDGVMNYLFRDLVLDYFARRRFPISTLDFLLGLVRLRYPEAANFALLNLLGSHDTARVITTFQEGLAGLPGHSGSYAEAVTHLRPALILQLTYPGAPLIYYGDELGMTGGPDPDCRRTMPWEPRAWDQDLLNFYRRLIALRQRLLPLRRGYFQPLFTDDRADVYAYARRLAGERVIVILNAGDLPQAITLAAGELAIADGTTWQDGLSGRYFEVQGGQISLPLEANSGAILYQS
ncbi:Neopullulanase 2 [Neomoorella glycerini]|uniref:Neopullulanase 2 n=1 Tax=Neomoorella glycerini TaxID=55779 RepID=A0A6I5ZM35_9FIRM|nr:alpha amylase N-terminal ig-like domain-containing protein [Moorella glycerini]QGP90952.1 Neopullulanase 2 [Moorella glycerini]